LLGNLLLIYGFKTPPIFLHCILGNYYADKEEYFTVVDNEYGWLPTKEIQLEQMHPGQPVEIKLDPFLITLSVVSIVSPASGAQFFYLQRYRQLHQNCPTPPKDIQGAQAQGRLLDFDILIWSLKLWSFP